MLAANHAGSGDEMEEHIGAEYAEQYESFIVQRVLSAQIEKAEQHHRHNLFHTKCMVMERSFCVIIDGGSLKQVPIHSLTTSNGSTIAVR